MPFTIYIKGWQSTYNFISFILNNKLSDRDDARSHGLCL